MLPAIRYSAQLSSVHDSVFKKIIEDWGSTTLEVWGLGLLWCHLDVFPFVQYP